MADTILHRESASATRKLHEELEALAKRVGVLEASLRGANSVIDTIRHKSMFAALPADEDFRRDHLRACDMLDFLGASLSDLVARAGASNEELPSVLISDLAGEAEDGQLRRVFSAPATGSIVAMAIVPK